MSIREVAISLPVLVPVLVVRYSCLLHNHYFMFLPVPVQVPVWSCNHPIIRDQPCIQSLQITVKSLYQLLKEGRIDTGEKSFSRLTFGCLYRGVVIIDYFYCTCAQLLHTFHIP